MVTESINEFYQAAYNEKGRAGAGNEVQVAHCTFRCCVSNFHHCIHKYQILLTLSGVLRNLPLTVMVSARPVPGH